MNTVGFLYRGYRRTRWFWELIVHIRRVCIVAILVLGLRYPLLQAYTCPGSGFWAVRRPVTTTLQLPTPYNNNGLGGGIEIP